jgi:hypothetical protein
MAVLVWACLAPARANEPAGVKVVREIHADAPGGWYVGNRPPLLPSPLLKLPIGSIRPTGWLRHELETETRGMIGHLEEISPWCKFDGNAWTDPHGKGHSGWEELPYWLKGYGDLGYVLRDRTIIRHARRWIDAVLAAQEPDGWFGPRALKTSLDGKPDLWPNMLMLNVLQSYHEYTKDPRVLPFMTRYFRWELGVPEKDFLAGYWPKIRAGDNLESVYWLYNRTGDKWLLDLAKKIHRDTANWTAGVANWHGVNFSQGFREPGVYYVQARDRKYLAAAERNYDTAMATYGQFPGGGIAADENARPGYTDPHQGCETCTWVEFLHSFEMLTRISGNPGWADRTEDIAFNSLPAALTPDQKALHYLTCANAVQLDRKNHAPGIENSGSMLSYSPFAVYRCCQHNVSHGWPYLAEELWLATHDKGLCASIYAPSEVTAKVGDGTEVRVTEETGYPFREQIYFKLALSRPTRFPLYLRVPGWCSEAYVTMNDDERPRRFRPHCYVMLDREWKDGDRVTLELFSEPRFHHWRKNKNAVSVEYGPLTFSLKIGEKYTRYGGTREWPELEVLPTTPWNYGLEIHVPQPLAALHLVRLPGDVPDDPWTPATVPLEITVSGKRIPRWTLDRNGLVAKLAPSPVRSTEPTQIVTLIPMGAARLRITAFPWIGTGPGAREWPAPPDITPSASHFFEHDTLDYLNDRKIPAGSGDQSIPRFTWWDHRGTREWVQYDFAKPREVSSVRVYWFDDTGRGQCRVPPSWRLLYKVGDSWKPVEAASAYGVAKDRFNKVTFKPVRTDALRLEAQLQKGYSAGILKWEVGP